MSPFLEDLATSSVERVSRDPKIEDEKQHLNQISSRNGITSPPAPSDSECGKVHDLLCIGFGPASLAIAIALNDALDVDKTIAGRKPDVCYLERQEDFAWHAGMLLPGSKMQISYIKDLATLRNPRSEFTFLNYLKHHKRLVQFANLGTFLPSRAEFQDYMRWCADHFREYVDYGQEVIEILPGRVRNGSQIDVFKVICRRIQDGSYSSRMTRDVVVAVGGAPHIPRTISIDDPHIVHSSQYCRKVPALLPDRDHAYRIAVLGSGQSAAEIFQNLHQRYPNSKTFLVIRDTALRPSDDSPFVNEVFDPDRVEHFYSAPDAGRRGVLKVERSTNYSVVRLELLEQIYHDLYQQRIRQPDERQWQHRLLTCREVCGVTSRNGKNDRNLTLKLKNVDPLRPGPAVQAEEENEEEKLELDALFLATGYTRNAHERLLEPLQHLRPTSPGGRGRAGGDEQQTWRVGRDYKVIMDETKVSPDSGIWLQGCNEITHGLADTLLSTLSIRGGEIVDSIFGRKGGLSSGSEVL